MKRELRLFLFIGLCTVGIDYLVYQLFLLFSSLSFAKGVGFISGTIFAYFVNRKITFQHEGNHKHSLWKFGLLYFLTLNLNIVANSLVFGFLQSHSFAKSFAFLIATGLSAAANFIGMKYFVFASSERRKEMPKPVSAIGAPGHLQAGIRKS